MQQSEPPPPSLALLDLPYEVLCLVLEYVPVRELLRGPALTCRLFRQAAYEDPAWRRRCEWDLGIEQPEEEEEPEEGKWRRTYALHAGMPWDPKHLTLSHADRAKLLLAAEEGGIGLSCNGASRVELGVNLFLENAQRRVRWGGPPNHLSIRSQASFAAGRHAFEFIIGKEGNHLFGVGLIDESWDCRLHAHLKSKIARSWFWWNAVGCQHTIVGRMDEYGKHIRREVTTAWGAGDRLGVLLNLDPLPQQPQNASQKNLKLFSFNRTIHFFKNGTWAESLALPDDVSRLWAAVTLYGIGDSVELHRVPKEQFEETLDQVWLSDPKQMERRLTEQRMKLKEVGWNN
ncbi:F-box/WD repeat-containing protein sel-10 [Balamuthia mandrillaris]